MGGRRLSVLIRQAPCARCSKRLTAARRPICQQRALGSTHGGEWPSSSSGIPNNGSLLTPLPGSPISTSAKQERRPPTSQFTSHTLRSIRSVLQRPPDHSPSDCPEHTVPYTRKPSEAAVLIPLMNIHGRPCVLLEKRSEELRVHAGEVSFPGGKADPTDATLAAAALREAQEELGLPPDHVEILGLLDPPEYSLGNKARVWAFVGFVHDQPFHPVEAALDSRYDQGQPLNSLHLSQLDPSPSEVSALIPLPLSTLVDGDRRSLHFFRMDPNKPYWKYTVGDLILPISADGSRYGVLDGESHSDDTSHKPWSARPEDKVRNTVGHYDNVPPWKKTGRDIELWGLSGWFLHELFLKMRWTTNPMKMPVED